MKGQRQQIQIRQKPSRDLRKTTRRRKRTKPELDRINRMGAEDELSGTEKKLYEDLPHSLQYEDDRMKWFEEGFLKGQYAGGNAIVDSLLPRDYILPDIPIEDLLAEGVEIFRPQMIGLIPAAELGDRLLAALHARTPMSVIRLGEGELLTLAQETVMPMEQLLAENKLLTYKGVNLPDLKARDMLLQSVTRASAIGITRSRMKYGLPLAFSLFRAYHLDYRQLPLTDSNIHYQLFQKGFMSKWTAGRKVLLVGNRAAELASLLRKHGVKVVADISPVNGMQDVPRIMEEVKCKEFDLALVSAGIAAVVITERIANDCGKVAIDVGHLADSLVQKEATFS